MGGCRKGLLAAVAHTGLASQKSNKGNAMRRLTAILLASVFAAAPAIAQDEGGGRAAVPTASYPAPTQFPNENHDLVARHLALALKAAGSDLFQDMAHRCIISPVFPKRVSGIQFNGKITPTRLFDNLYSVGQNEVSAQALVTSGGIILFDTLNNEDEAKNILVPNMIALGLDPHAIKYIVISHEHGDHYGGARYLQQTYGAKVVASAVAWAGMAANKGRGPFGALPLPDKDIEMADGQSLTLGDTTVTFWLTPGHTKGDMSAIYKVTDNGASHVVGYFGGTGGGRDAESEKAQIASLERWKDISRKAGADVNITNHPLHSEALEKEYLLRYRGPGQPNPFVLGRSVYQRYIEVQQECAKVELARMGIDADAR
jgi:metallo-beta-lactamase class B